MRKTVLEEIWSGGQTGADQAGLWAARDLGLETGGWIPRGFVTEAGLRPDFKEEFGLRETISPQYPQRTEMNVRDTDATVIFSRNRSPGTRITVRRAEKYGRPHVILLPLQGRECENADALLKFLRDNGIRRLNVAGNRESKSPGIFDEVRQTIVMACMD